MDVEFGNAGRLDTQGTGWIVGFSPWTRSGGTRDVDLRYMEEDALSRTLSIKWKNHPAPDPDGGDRPISEGRTISILASETGKFRVKFSLDQTYPAGHVQEYLLEKHGDYVIWGEGIFHSWSVESPCTIMSVRWVPVSSM
jgi:hypothetical protein